ncbi:helix-hairpin-helix domain-containing protein [Kitasatospora sp. NPDC001664]
MRTMTPGAARRRETTETVRGRVAHLFLPPGPHPEGERADSPTAVWSEAWDTPLPSRPAASVRGGPPGEGEAAGGGRVVGEGGLVGEGGATGRQGRPRAGPEGAAPGAAGVVGRRLPGVLLFDRRAVAGLTVLLLLAVGYAVQHFWLGRPGRVAVPAVAAVVAASAPSSVRPGVGSGAGSGAGAPTPPTGPTVVVDVAGKVRQPGLRTLPSGARVADALTSAGGPLPDTVTDGLNLARVLTDGEQILVGGAPAGAGLPAGGATPAVGPLSINQATREQLDALPGVGPTLAQRILQHRQEHGPFRSLDQLREVSGIGERKFADLRALLTL